MYRGKAFLTVVFLIALMVAGYLLPSRGESGIGQPKGRQKWQYARLSLDGSNDAYIAAWEAGKTVVASKLEKSERKALNKIYKGLDGKEKAATLGVLLDHIGQDTWELVSHTRLVESGVVSQTWTFKRPAP
jgi:hypothetical protein